MNADDNHGPLNDSTSEAVNDVISSADGSIQSEVVEERGEPDVVERQSPVKGAGKQVSEETETKTKTPGAGVTLDFAGITKHWRKFSIDLMPKVRLRLFNSSLAFSGFALSNSFDVTFNWPLKSDTLKSE